MIDIVPVLMPVSVGNTERIFASRVPDSRCGAILKARIVAQLIWPCSRVEERGDATQFIERRVFRNASDPFRVIRMRLQKSIHLLACLRVETFVRDISDGHVACGIPSE